MPLTVTVTPGTQIADGILDQDTLNLLAQPTIAIDGTLATANIANGAVTAAKLTTDAYLYCTEYSAAAVGGTYYLYVINANTVTPAVGMILTWKASVANTIAATKIALRYGTTGTAYDLQKFTGATLGSLAIGDVKASGMTLVAFDGSKWQLLSR